MATVLIVDDSKTSRRILKNILIENGYEIIGEAARFSDIGHHHAGFRRTRLSGEDYAA